MSEHHPQNSIEHHVVEHHSPIRTPTQLIVVVVLSFVVPVIALIMIAAVIVGTPNTSASNPALSDAAVAQRIQPVGQFVAADSSAVGGGARSGEDVTKGACIACHGAGVLGAPKIGDKAAWGKLISQGLDKLTASAIKGVKQMPPRGGDTSLSDLDISRAIVYMANQSGGSLKEPAATAAPAVAKK